MRRSINYSSRQREEKIIRSFIAKCRANSLCWVIYEESARAQLTREHARSARRSRKPRGTAAFPVCTARRSSLKICQPHGRQKHVFFFFCRATSQRARAKNSDVFSHNTIYLLPLVFLVEQSRPSRDNYADNGDARRYPSCRRIYRSVPCFTIFLFVCLFFNIADLCSFTHTHAHDSLLNILVDFNFF